MSVALLLIASAGGAAACEASAEEAVQIEPAPAPSAPIKVSTQRLVIGRRHLLADVASIIEADVASMRYEFSEQHGPRTVVTLANLVVHAGARPAGMEFSQTGGPLPDGRFYQVLELPRFSVGSRYVLFLSALPWLDTPLWGTLAFRIEPFAGKHVVLTAHGQPVLEFGVSEVRFGATRVINVKPDVDLLAPQSRAPEVTDTAPDIALALTPREFAKAAVAAANAVGAPLGAPVSFSPDPARKWNGEEVGAPPASDATVAAQGAVP